jgi:hypothetical protein
MKNTNEPRTLTEAQINANRENAQKSTGPRTSEGKAASSRNRLVHGLRANKHIVLDEDPAEFLLLIHDHLDRFRPVGPGEEKLVLRIAAGQWRLDRAFPMEAGIYRACIRDVAEEDAERQEEYTQEKENAASNGGPEPPAPNPPGEGDLLARAFEVDSSGFNSLAKLARYETAIERSIDRSLRQLKNLQVARNASPSQSDQPSPPPAQPLNLHPETSSEAPAPPPGTDPQNAEPPASTSSNDANYHLNPKNEGIARSTAVTLFLAMRALLLFLVGYWQGGEGFSASIDRGAANPGRSRLFRRPEPAESRLNCRPSLRRARFAYIS